MLPTDMPNIVAVVATSNKILYGGDAATTDGGPVWYASTPNIRTVTSATGFDLTAVQSIAYNGSNLYVAGGYKTGSNRPLYYSSDGQTWSAPASPGSNVLANCYSVAYANGLWIAGGRGSNNGVSDASENFLTSTDGSNWTRRFGSGSNRIPGIIRRIAYGNGRWVLAGNVTAGTSNLMVSTDDAATWTVVVSPMPTLSLTGLTYGNGMWVLGGNRPNSPLYSSPDAVTWTAGTGVAAWQNVVNVYYSPGSNMFLAMGNSASVALSSNGSEWAVQGSTVETIYAVADTCLNTWIAPAGSARMYFPYGMVYDPSGTLYIADSYNNRIRAIAAGSSAMTTFAGSGADTVSNGTLTTGGIARPSVLVRDPSSGTFYISSQDRQTIQSIAGSNVSLFAGAIFSAGYADGPALSARFNGPTGLTLVGNNVYVGEIYNGDVRRIVTFPNVRPGLAPPGYTIIATSNYPITMTSRIDVSWTSVGGVLQLYKYEPFSNTFRAKIGSDTLGYSPSSTELLGYLTGTGSANVAFRGPNGATTAYSYPLVLDLQALSGTTVVDDISTTVIINPSRLIVTPCNSSLVFYRNEPISPVTFSIVASRASLIYSASTLPTGLTLTSNTSNSFTLRGTPAIQSLSSNYTILGQDTSGRTYSTVVSMAVNPERLILDVSGSTSFGNLVSTTPITPVTLTARFPPYGSVRSMRYTWSPQPPTGLQFRDSNGTALSGSSYSIQAADSSFSLTLAGTITDEQIRAFANTNPPKRTVTTTIVGTRTAPLPSLSPSLPTTLTFTMGQVILFDSNITTPFVGIRTLNWSYSATSYFGTDVSISSISVTDGFLPDGITGSFSSNFQRFDLSGTPTTLSSYAFTLTATAGSLSASLPVSFSTVNDTVFITTPSDTRFNFIQYRDLSNAKSGFYSSNLVYTATSTSGCNAMMTGSGLPDGVTLAVVDASLGKYRLSGRPTTAAGLSTATLSAVVPASGATSSTTFQYSVSDEVFTFDPSGGTFTFAQNVPISPTQLTATTLSENPIIRYSSGDLPPTLTIANTGLVR
jgi:hypothetical protein